MPSFLSQFCHILKSLSSALMGGEKLFYRKNIFCFHTIVLLSIPEDAVVFVVHKRLSFSFHRPKHSLAPRLSPEPTQPLIVAVAPPPVLFNTSVKTKSDLLTNSEPTDLNIYKGLQLIVQK